MASRWRAGVTPVAPACAAGRRWARRAPASSSSCGRASWARARWPRWMGSNVPPRIPRRARRLGHTQAPGFRIPLQLGVTDAHGVASLDAGLAQLLDHAHLGQLTLEASSRLLVLEVGLGHEPLDASAFDGPHATGLALDDEALLGRVVAMDHDAGGLAGSAQLLVGGQQPGQGRAQLARPARPARPRPGTTSRPSWARASLKARSISRSGSRSILLATTRVVLSSSSGSRASSSSRMTW